MNTKEGFCRRCLKRILTEQALCCANFQFGRGLWRPCEGIWCDGCYRIEDHGIFPIRRPTDEAGYVVEVEKDKSRFLFGRAGDHLVTTFQCDLCHFRNITSRSPGDDEQDGMLLHFIRRANLDALWSREKGTIKNTMREIANIRERARLLGFDGDAMLPPMGPHPVEDVVGMGLAVCVLQRSLDVGRNEATVQFSTTQKMKTAYANMWRASLEGSKSSVFSRDTAKMFTTTCPTHGDWNERFSKGMHERMGDKVKQDLVITIEQMMRNIISCLLY